MYPLVISKTGEEVFLFLLGQINENIKTAIFTQMFLTEFHVNSIDLMCGIPQVTLSAVNIIHLHRSSLNDLKYLYAMAPPSGSAVENLSTGMLSRPE